MDAPLYLDLAEAPAGGTAQYHQTADGTRIRVAVWQGGARGTVLLMPGRTEYIEKYGRAVTRLVAMGLNVVCVDFRGQGLSDRINNTTDLGHVKHFSEFQQDVAVMVKVAETLPGPRLLMAHSMGGCIGLRALTNGLNVAGAVFSAPMWGLNLPVAQRYIAPFVVRFLRAIGKGEDFAPGSRNASHVNLRGFEGNPLTNNKETFDWFRNHLDAQPQLALGAPSIAWIAAAVDEIDALLDVDMPETPVLTGLGSAEVIVSTSAIITQMERLPNSTLINFEGAKHELLMETPEIQAAFWARIEAFFTQLGV